MIFCAAIQVTYRNQSGKEVTVVIPGLRHGTIWELMSDLGLPPKSQRKEVEGFLTTSGRFLDRKEAFDEALSCGQLSSTVRTYKADQGERELYSEDLY